MTEPKEKVEVNYDFLQKVVGFAEATNAMMKSAEEGKKSLRGAATDAVDALEKAGKLEEGQRTAEGKEKLIQGFVGKPEMALKLAASLAAEVKAEIPKSEGKEQTPIGGAAESEDKIKRAAEGQAGPKYPANVTQEKKSDEVWNNGFDFTA